MKTLLVISMILTAGVVMAQDAKTLTSSRNGCQLSVPGTWVIGGIRSMANSPDKQVSAIVSSPRIDSFAVLKDNAKKLYPEAKVTKDSAVEFQMEAKSMNGKPNVYRATASGPKYCIAEVIYQSGTVEEARKIAETLK